MSGRLRHTLSQKHGKGARCVCGLSLILFRKEEMAGGKQKIIHLVLAMLSLRCPGDLKIEIIYSLQLRGEVWAGDVNLAMSECATSVVLKGTEEKGGSHGIL